MKESPQKGIVPPSSKESEMMVLGCMLTSINSLNIASDALNSFDFYFTEHQTIFDILKTAYKQDKPADVHLVCEELKRQEKLSSVGGVSYVTTLAQYAGTSAYIEEYVDVVRNKATLRRMIHVAQDIEKNALQNPQDVSVALDEAQQKLFNIGQAINTTGGVLIREILSGVKSTSKIPYLKELQQKQELYQERGPGDQGITGVPSHFIDLDKMINGMVPSNLMILAARPAMGKCVTGDTLILDPTSGALRSIKDLVNKKSGHIATLNKDWLIKTAPPFAFIADGIKPTFKVKTALGKELEATAVHPLLTVKGWKRLEDLKVGDRIGLPRALPYFGTKQWPEHEVKALAYFIADGCLTGSCPSFTNLNPKIVADFKEAVHAFGHVRIRDEIRKDRAPNYKVALNHTPFKDLKDRFSHAFSLFSEIKRRKVHELTKKLGLNVTNVYASASASTLPSSTFSLCLEEEFPELPSLASAVRINPVTTWLKDLGLYGKDAHQKTFPSAVFELSKENIAILLNRLFSCDGTAYVAKCDERPFPIISYSSVSKELIYQVQHLLLRFSILAKVRSKKTNCQGKTFPSFELEIHGKSDLIRFCQDIGIYGKEKAVSEVIRAALSTPVGWTKDILPIDVWDIIREKKGHRSWTSLFKAKGLEVPSNMHDGNRSIRRDTLAKIATVLDDQELMNLAHSDVYWDKIISIEPTGEKEVFDLTVEGTHNFVAADILVHNTSLAINIAENICFRSEIPVGIFSLEMSADQLLHRLICSQAEVESDKIKSGSLNGGEFQRIVAAVNSMQKGVMVIDDQPGLKITDLRARARRMKEAHGIQFLVIDYLQLLSGSGVSKSAENRQSEISEISRMLKNLARELNLPILCLSQLSRKVEERPGHRPMMSDLRESGCLTGDTEIRDAHTGKLYTIRELAERKEQSPIFVYAVDENLKVGPHKMVKAFYSGQKEVYELKTRSGRSIKASANHPFLKLEGWTRLDQLKKGTRIALPRQFQELESSNPISNEELTLFAHLLGDRYILPNQPYHYTSADLENIEHVSNSAHSLFGIQSRIVKQKNLYHLYLPSLTQLAHKKYHPISSWFSSYGLDRVRSYEKKIPKAVFECNSQKISTFLHHLWATNGNISLAQQKNRKDGASIYFASSSKEMCKQNQGLLLSRGIQSTLAIVPFNKGYRDMHHVRIQGATNQKVFLSKVGSAGKRGPISSELLTKLNEISENPNCDTIPKEAWKTVIKQAKEDANLGWREVCKGLNMSYCGSSLFKNGISRQRMEKLAAVMPSKQLHNLAHSDVYWDEILSIEKLGLEDVYDATVENVHNFVANDILVHNSIEQDSDIVMFLLRREYYDPYDKPGMAELIVAKNRHGGVGSVNLTFRKELAQFSNYSASLSEGKHNDNQEAFSAFSPN